MDSSRRIPEILGTAVAGLTAGGMLYITMIEAPARAKLSPAEQLTDWRTSFTPAKNVFKPTGLLMVPSLCALAYNTSNPIYYAAAVPFGLLAPFTVFTIAATNERLLTMKEPEDDAAKEEVSSLVARWAKRHAVRSMFTSVGFALCLYGLSQPKKS